MWKKTSSVSKHCKPRPELQQQFQERSKSRGYVAEPWTWYLDNWGNWLERQQPHGIFAGENSLHGLRLGSCDVFFWKMACIRREMVWHNVQLEFGLMIFCCMMCMVRGWRQQLPPSGPPCIDALFFLHDQFHLKSGCEISYPYVSCN